MTTPASGAIGIANINTEMGLSASANSSLNFIKTKTKAAYQQASPTLSNYYNKAYYQKSNEGNCSNGNCTSNCNCGDTNCTNCIITGTVNCVNCDGQPLLQPNCNCACTYNCTTTTTSYNCNCNCACECACLCANCDTGG